MSQNAKGSVPKFGSFKPKGTTLKTEERSKSKTDEQRRRHEHHRKHQESSHRSKRRRLESHESRQDESRSYSHRHRHTENPESRPDSKTLTQTVASDGLEDSDSFIVDLRGDAKNVEFGSLHRYSIPAYHRNGYGNLVGAPSGAKIDRDQSNDKCVTLSRRTGDRNDVGRLRLMAGFSLNERRLRLVAPTTSSLSGVDVSSDFISLYGDSELKQGPKASDSGDHVDYRSIDSKAKHTNHLEDEDLEFASDTGEDLQNQDTELRVRQENAALVRQTKERHNDVNAWRALIEHQARVICPGVDFSRLTASRKRTVAEIRLSIYDQALKHVTVDKPGYESLVCGMMAESSLVWDNHRLSRKWQDILRNTPTSMELWTLYLDHVQTTHNKFKYESWKATFVQCLETLQKARLSTQQPGSIQHIQIYVFLRCTAFIRDSGYDELAYGLWQAIFEQHCRRPVDIPYNHANLKDLGEFWESDTPRLGEDQAMGWSHYVGGVDKQARIAQSTPLRPIDLSRPLHSMAEQETQLAFDMHLPASADDDGALDDPFRHVMFTDIQDVCASLVHELPRSLLLDAFLAFMHLPPIPNHLSGPQAHIKRSDQFLEEFRVANPVRSVYETDYSLFQTAFGHTCDQESANNSSVGEHLQFVDRILKVLNSSGIVDDDIGVYHIAFSADTFGPEALKIAKKLLKGHSSSLRLYNAYALAEAKVGKGLSRAAEVWRTAIGMSQSLGENAAEGSAHLWHGWVHSCLAGRDEKSALNLLLAMSDDIEAFTQKQENWAGIPPSQRLKSTQHLDSMLERMLYQGKPGPAACFADCRMWLEYLANGNSLDAILELVPRLCVAFSRSMAPATVEQLLHQTQTALIRHHMDNRRPYKPAIVRANVSASVQKFPENSMIISVYFEIQRRFQIEDRIRASLHDETLAKLQSNLIGWSHLTAEELQRYSYGSAGSSESTVRSTFMRALLDPTSVARHSSRLWKSWFEFEQSLYHQGGAINKQKQQAVVRMKQVFLDGLRYLPWHKAWIIMGLRAFAGRDLLPWQELRQMYDVLIERELRIRVLLRAMVPELVTEFSICAAADGVVLDQVGRQNRAQQSLQLSYGNGTSARTTRKKDAVDKLKYCQAYGIVGVLDLVACSFLIAIIRREQVAQICDRPIYSVKDVAIIPLSSQAEAEEAIIAAKGPSELEANSENEQTETSVEDGGERQASPDSELPKNPSGQGKAFAKNVLQNRGRYGRFAEKWFSKAGWNENRRRGQGMSKESSSKQEEPANESASKKQSQESPNPPVDAQSSVTSEGDGDPDTKSAAKASNMIVPLIPRILRAAKLYFSTSGFYFSYDDDISATLMQPDNSDTATACVPLCKRFNEEYYWNKHLQHPFIDAEQYAYALPLLHGFVGQRAFCVLRDQQPGHDAVSGSSLGIESSLANPEQTRTPYDEENAKQEKLLLTLISRRSVNRAGLRYLRRGVDDAGNVANAVETEQILSPQSQDKKGKIFSLLQVRGSIPLLFSQSPYSFKPQPVLHGTETKNQLVLKRHLDKLIERHGNVHCACLVDKHGTEKEVGKAFESQMQRLIANQYPNYHKSGFEWFDFHAECKGMRFENVSILLDRLRGPLEDFGWGVRQGDRTSKRQHGVIRTNCMDCLDRTNVVQSAVAGWALEQQLLELGLRIDLKADPKTQWFNNLWADNGDAISKQYTGTSALKGDFTRTRKRNWIGALSDLSLTLTRYYNNIFSDYFLQLNIDYFLGNVGPSAFDDFEADMTGHDNVLDIQRVRADAVELCISTVIDESKENYIAGWTLGYPHEANTLISHPFEECVLLLTDAALHFCRIDWNAERVDKFERIGLLDILEIWKGPYVTSTLGVTHTDESTNVGFAFRYNTRNDAVIRSNERTMGSGPANDEATPGIDEQLQPEEGGETRLLAFKVLPRKSSITKTSGGESTEASEQDTLENICHQLHGSMARAAEEQRGVDHLKLEKVPEIQDYPVVSAVEARKNTGYTESIGYTIKKLIWS
ncbi:DUF1740-domain-containing protein [Hortaea werneckii]|nr:DUF1740-domain-containing protein [Hortaea werneckii]